MIELIASAEFEDWLLHLRDLQARARVYARLDRVANGNLGDVKSVGSGISELRIPHGPGYRLYISRRGTAIVLLLCGGDKSTQRKDIERAKQIAADFEELA